MIFDTLDQLEMYIPVLPAIRVIADTLDHDELYDKAPGKYSTRDSKVNYTISEYVTGTADKPFEYHRDHTDVMIMLSGQELMSTSWRELKNQSQAFDTKADVGFFQAEPITVLQAAQYLDGDYVTGKILTIFGNGDMTEEMIRKIRSRASAVRYNRQWNREMPVGE